MNFYRNRYVSWFIWRFILVNPRFRLWLTKQLVKEEDKEIRLLGSKLHINTVGEIGYLKAWEHESHNIVFRDEVPSLLNMALILEPTDTFVDIGANVGLYSSVLARFQYAFPNMPWYAFEANPATVERLRKTLADKNVVIECLAVSNQKGSLSFTQGAASNTFASAEGENPFNDKTKVVTVEAIRLNDYELKGNSLVFKIDVEGHEWQVLEGADRYFAEGRVKAVFLDGFSDKRIAPFLEARGFQCFSGRSFSPDYPLNEGTLFLNKRWLESRPAR